VTGKAYGAAFALLGSKALGADLTFALPTAEISILAPDAAVAFLWNDQVTADVTRASLEAKWVKECASAEVAAEKGAIDDVIDPAELRQRICAGLSMLLNKADGGIWRKHTTLPL
jgi:acetyl-CoA carboxylase carboxyltransferase component